MIDVEEIRWEERPDIERIPGKCGGRAVVMGTRVEPEAILIDAEYGRTPEQTHESFPSVPISTIRAILAYA